MVSINLFSIIPALTSPMWFFFRIHLFVLDKCWYCCMLCCAYARTRPICAHGLDIKTTKTTTWFNYVISIPSVRAVSRRRAAAGSVFDRICLWTQKSYICICVSLPVYNAIYAPRRDDYRYGRGHHSNDHRMHTYYITTTVVFFDLGFWCTRWLASRIAPRCLWVCVNGDFW